MKNSAIYKNYELIKNHKTTHENLVQDKLTKSEQSLAQKENIILDLYAKEALEQAKLLDKDNIIDIFSSATVLVKDNTNIKNHITTSGCLIFEDFISSYNATIINNIQKHKGIILGKTNLDEFGHAGTGTWSGYGIVTNVLDKTRITGGSSSGSVSAVQDNLCDFAIGSDTGDSIRHPASFLGIVGFKPSYGLISRYGVTPFASSLDHVGVIAKTVMDVAIGTDMIKGYDPKDLTSVHVTDQNFYENLKEDSNFKITILKDVADLMTDEVKNKFEHFVSDLKRKYQVNYIDFDKTLLEILGPLYASISFFEGLTNWNNINGILFGGKDLEYHNFNDLIVKVRSKLGGEVKNRYMISNLLMNEDNFNMIYENSTKIRRIVVNRINEIFNDSDIVLIPSSSSFAPKLEYVLERKYSPNYCDDALMIANFAGLPSITIPLTSDENKDAFGINLTGKKFNDQKVLNIAYNLEKFIKDNGYYNE